MFLLENVLLNVVPFVIRVLSLKLLDKVVTEHLLEVSLVVVHDGEVLFVQIKASQVERTVGETQPEPVIGVDFQRPDAFEEQDVADIELDPADLRTFEQDRVVKVLLHNFGSAEHLSEDVREVLGYVGVQSSCQIPRFHDPMVVQASAEKNIC